MASTGRSLGLRVLLRKTTQPIEAERALLPRWVSLFLAKRSRHSCSTRSSKKNMSAKSSASRNNDWPGALNFSDPTRLKFVSARRRDQVAAATAPQNATIVRWRELGTRPDFRRRRRRSVPERRG